MFEWDDLLPVAERLVLDAGNEAALRTAINRAYYVAYHAAASFVRSHGLLESRHTHARVWEALTRSPIAEQSEIGQVGDLLRRSRIDADYGNPFPGTVDKRAREAVADAQALIEALRRLG